MARKYGFLRSRVLLYRQDELAVLERDLMRLDADDEKNRDLALRSRKHDEETDTDPVYSRRVLMQKIDDKLKEYGQHHLLLMSCFDELTQFFRWASEQDQDISLFQSSLVAERKNFHRLDR